MNEPLDTPNSSSTGAEPTVSPVWPPPPALAPPVMAQPLFASTRRLSQAITILLGIYAGISVMGIAAGLLLPTQAQMIVTAAVSTLQALLLLAAGPCFLIWTYRLVKNLRAFGVSGLRYTPGWAVGYFFIPILSLYRPYQIFCEIWQASDPSPEARAGQVWQNIKVPALIISWWVFLLLTNAIDALSSQTPGNRSAGAWDNLFDLLCALLTLYFVRLFTARHEKTAQILLLTPAPDARL